MLPHPILDISAAVVLAAESENHKNETLVEVVIVFLLRNNLGPLLLRSSRRRRLVVVSLDLELGEDGASEGDDVFSEDPDSKPCCFLVPVFDFLLQFFLLLMIIRTVFCWLTPRVLLPFVLLNLFLLQLPPL
ncbi:hypothetical protein NE237_031610 [Protea cynaroides]|uniref:Uncharacterized protein n=1 Tax=Protea cynaroides TaxID=273540 RepID=A0A9Q0R2B8_9MAGN|nr:hypothetical protein NE237_031610 [Protea cynaroides]